MTSDPSASAPRTIAVIGAGIVGVSTALRLQEDGHDVMLIDRDAPAAGTSYGNGGVLASCSIVPVTGPGLLRKAPGMVLNPRQPLFLKWSYLPKLLPWLTQYLRHANAADTERIAEALNGIVGDSLNDHQALAQGTGAEKYIVPSDYAFLYNDRTHYQGDAFGWSLRKAAGFQWDELEGQQVQDMDPIFSPDLGFAARLGGHGVISDPGAYVKALASHFERQGGRFVKGEVQEIIQAQGRVSGLRLKGKNLNCDDAVLTAGVWSGPLAKSLGVNIPLESERGYHLEFWEPSVMPRTPVMVASGKFVITPMDGRVRCAGVVEFGGLKAPPSEAPFKLLRDNARAAIPGLTWAREEKWMGHRPAPTDSIPIIGPVPKVPGAWMGFGHHHIGLTGGPKTGQLLAQMISGRKPNIDVRVYSPARFG